jgi:hypothetical protein
MTATRISRRVNAPRSKVYRALLDFIELVPDEKVVEVVEFETAS